MFTTHLELEPGFRITAHDGYFGYLWLRLGNFSFSFISNEENVCVLGAAFFFFLFFLQLLTDR